uniref:Uncharacterized protein n=1 Tax=Octopus bimaculoides TaxID=37653 RepID=A0A0L8G9T0_OCTBM
MLNETLMFPDMNYSNPKEFLSTHGYDALPLLLIVIGDAHIVNHRQVQLVMVKQLTSKSVVLNRIFTVSHLYT